MSKNIAFLLQRHFCDYCRQTLSGAWNGASITYFCYENLKELQQIFLDNKSRYDAFFVSGDIPMAALWEVDTPPYAIKNRIVNYLTNTYRALLSLTFEGKRYDPARIGIDCIEEGVSLTEVLEEDCLPELAEEYYQQFLGMTAEELDRQEELLVANYRRRCREGKLDLVITFFNSVVQGLAGESVECYYSYPSFNSMVRSLEAYIKEIQMKRLQQNQSAVIRVSPRYDLRRQQLAPNRGLELLTLKSSLLEYCRSRRIEPVLKDDLTDIELYLTVEQLGNITGQFTCFDLPAVLEEKAGFQGFVSLGSGEDLIKARDHAIKAQEYRASLEQEGCIYIDESGGILSLPDEKSAGRPAEDVPSCAVEAAANRCHLSAETIYRVISAMQTEQTDLLTSNELIRHGNFSLRVANRVLAALVSAGYAQIAGQRRVGNKGRPLNLYRISFGF